MTVMPYDGGPQPIGTDLAHLQPGNNVERLASMLTLASEIARVVADTDFVPEAIRGSTPAVTAVILYGDELGIGAMQALASIDFIKGKPSPSAHLSRALILRAGHSFLIHEATGVRCKVSGLRRGRPESERVFVTWDLDMARSAGLVGAGGNWNRYPRAMLLARATTELGRQVFPDVMRGLGGIGEGQATVEEMAGWQTDGGGHAAAEPASTPGGLEPSTVQRKPRKRAPAKKPEPVPQPSDPAVDVQLPIDGDATALPVRVDSGTSDATAVASPLPPPPEPDDGTPADPPVVPKMASPGLLRGYHAAFKEAGIPDADRELRLAITSHVAGRVVNSSTELTRAEALRVTGALAEVATGAASVEWDHNGQVVLRSLRDEPEPDGGGDA